MQLYCDRRPHKRHQSGFASPFLLHVSTIFMLTTAHHVSAFSLSDQPLSSLLTKHATKIEELKSVATLMVGDDELMTREPYCNDVFYLRYAMCDEKKSEASDMDATTLLKTNIAWRLGDYGKSICDAATMALEKATASSWNNEPVLQAAPSSSTITKYLTPSTCLTTQTSKGDLLYCIRAGQITDVELMKALDNNLDPLVDFFVYCKEVNALVANLYSTQQNRLVSVLVANDLTGVKLIGGDASFRQALSKASKITNPLYPTLNGPTLLLNLPPLLGALVKLFSGLFPPQVKDRIRFEQGPLGTKVQDLMEVSYGGKGRDVFLNEIDDLVYND